MNLFTREVDKIVNKISLENFSDLVKIKPFHYNFRADVLRGTRYALRLFRSEAAWMRNSLPNKISVCRFLPPVSEADP